MPATIEVRGLVKRYGPVTAVDEIDFTVDQGEFFGFLGPNGAGKTTTINVLCTLTQPTTGSVRVAGYDVLRESHFVRQRIGIIFQDPSLDTQLTAWENLALHARVYGIPSTSWRPRAEELLRMVELWERRHSLVRTFSGGMKRRLEIVRSLLHAPEILFLDEPTLGLDPQTRGQIWAYLTELRRQTGVTLFLTTHYLEEAEQCDRIAIIDHGRIIALDAPERLKARVARDIILLSTEDNTRAVQELKELFGLGPMIVDGTVRIEVERGDELIPQLARQLTVPIHSVSLRRPSLDDVFLALTGRQIRDEEASDLDLMREQVRARH
ncbi:ATP-binding cassette domain-containing protein [Thermomicrobium sp. CFH 73360]|uniref:ATP-binding cassette domain-containing protein n=1 Tax=Thermomicrobium sp. CFH 73360 TaxID=2951987 RepID=UPI002076E3CC|nr:ATP-binding cassette domain-containing protein [Thermomicrobium sp. CFH 73360]MCM8747373.1 ATP-binding cassette domain-containing protein [Thermomicrobium sp. CFH 73360]